MWMIVSLSEFESVLAGCECAQVSPPTLGDSVVFQLVNVDQVTQIVDLLE